MKTIKSPKDFWAGLMFIAFGIAFVAIARNYQMGTALRMGPAYFPTVLGWFLAVLGAIVFLRSLVLAGPRMPQFVLLPLVAVIVAVVAFGYALKPLGLVGASLLLVFIAAAGGHDTRWKEVVLLWTGLIVFSVLVFVRGLTLPFPVWPVFMG